MILPCTTEVRVYIQDIHLYCFVYDVLDTKNSGSICSLSQADAITEVFLSCVFHFSQTSGSHEFREVSL